MTIAIVGLGSMGKRRCRLLNKIFKNTNILIGIDTNKERREECELLFNIKCYDSLQKAQIVIGSIDCVIICTSPLSHYSLGKIALEMNCDVFTEINLVDTGYDDLINLAHQKDKILFLSSTHLYNRDIQTIIEKSKKQKNITYNLHIGQYLPDWHPWESYKNFFVANKETNACREIFAINLPWLEKAFGKITDILVERKKSTNLEIMYPDTYIVIIKHQNGNSGVFCMDVVCRKAINHFEMYNENIFITWDGKPDSLMEYSVEKKEMKQIKGIIDKASHDSKYEDFIIEDNYENELKVFFDAVYSRKNNNYGFEDDKEILTWITKIEGNL